MKKLLAVAILFSIFHIEAAQAQSGVFTGPIIGCLTKDLLDDANRAALAKDYRLFNSYLGTDCYPLKGQEYSVVRRGFLKTKVRVYAGGGSLDLWVPSELMK